MAEEATQQNQQNQKTIAAFITGLLVGGLLVWIFTSAADDATPASQEQDDAIGVINDRDNEDDADADDQSNAPSRPVSVSDSRLEVDDQAAGTRVVISYVEYPATTGWIVVHEIEAGELGRALGATRFDTDAGRLPTEVPLLRGTVAGSTYEVVFYSDNGDRQFSTRLDQPIMDDGERISTTFTAQAK